MHIFLRSIILILSIGFTMDVFAATPGESTFIVLGTGSGTTTASGEADGDIEMKHETEEEKKEREKTINDINTFLIESYKLKVDRILANLNISIERVTDNNPVAQAKLLEKIRGDISMKLQAVNSRNISENRRKILSSVFSYIQENLDAKISRLAKQK